MTDQERLNFWWNRAILAERALDRIDKILEKDPNVDDIQKVMNDYFE